MQRETSKFEIGQIYMYGTLTRHFDYEVIDVTEKTVLLRDVERGNTFRRKLHTSYFGCCEFVDIDIDKVLSASDIVIR